ncbi:MAG: hypothetical protein B7X41_00815 [Microbacterium sp. 14-71-5]|nr:MAG: hypothetical protein B7X41_00815 [Microbacterium sp. 14-71-5]
MTSRAERYREIVDTLSVHGFGFAVGAVGLQGRFPFKRGLPGHEPGRIHSQPEHLRLALEQLGPTFVKVGQILSTRPDLLPPDYLAELAKLQDDAAPTPTDEMFAAIVEELGSTDAFDVLDPRPLASASIGQAYAAEIAGAEVVVKVRRPGVVETVEQDLEILAGLAERASRHSAFAREHDVVGIVHDFARTLRNELDYRHEAGNAERFAENFAADADVLIPAVVWETTTSRVLTLERVRGLKIDDLSGLDAAAVDRPELAQRAVRVLCQMVFEDGFFHADPHPGNFFVLPDGRLALIDFGMVGELDDELRHHLVSLLGGLVRRDSTRTTRALLDLAESSAPVDESALRDEVGVLIDRFGALTLAEVPLGTLVREIMALLRRHRLRMPGNLALLAKTLLMAEGLGTRLDPEFQLSVVLAPYAEKLLARDLGPEALVRRVTQVLRDLLAAGVQAPHDLHGLAEALGRGGLDLHLRTSELAPLLRELDRIGNRVVVGVVAAALVDGLSRVVTAPGRRTALTRPLLVLGTGALAVAGGYLAATARSTAPIHEQPDRGPGQVARGLPVRTGTHR